MNSRIMKHVSLCFRATLHIAELLRRANGSLQVSAIAGAAMVESA